MPKPNAGYIRRTDRQRQALRPKRTSPAELSAPTIPADGFGGYAAAVNLTLRFIGDTLNH